MENAGLEGSVIVNKVKEMPEGVGFNALTEEYVEMVEAGILDPAKVTRSALQNATSVASTFLTTEAVVAELPANVVIQPTHIGLVGQMVYMFFKRGYVVEATIYFVFQVAPYTMPGM